MNLSGRDISFSVSDDPEKRRRFAQSLEERKDQRAIKVLASLLKDPDADVRLQAVESLHAIAKSATSIQRDASFAADTEDNTHGNRTAENCSIALAVALNDDNAHIRWRAAGAIGSIGRRGASAVVVADLLRLLHDANKHVAWAATDALEVVGDEEAIKQVRHFKRSRYRKGG